MKQLKLDKSQINKLILQEKSPSKYQSRSITDDIKITNFKQICCFTEDAGEKAKKAFSQTDYTLLIQQLSKTDDSSVLRKELGNFPCILQQDWTYTSPKTTCFDITD